jgi:hypothetical protein
MFPDVPVVEKIFSFVPLWRPHPYSLDSMAYLAREYVLVRTEA